MEIPLRVNNNLTYVFTGGNLLSGLSEGDKKGINAAASKVRASMAAYWFGAEFPTEDLQALSKAEKKIAQKIEGFHLYPKSGISGKGFAHRSDKKERGHCYIVALTDTSCR